MKHLYFIRHGLSEANKAGVWSGSLTDTPLAPEGHEQAKKAGANARANSLCFDIIISSPMDRAHQTAKHISNAVNYPHNNIILHDSFVERSFGELEGKTGNAELFAHYGQDESSIDIYNDVERLVDLQWRAQEALNYLHTLPQDTILVVSHGAFGRALRRAINKEPLNIPIDAIPNAEIIKLI